ncbi:hypothetical protein [uncultured Nonlabens sp.]|uniref:hypothetical protein n=1 Tax=uncultured Nonlabens sp. TaxID=859306 RepID=UPI00262D913F|nr:hypothetical protein [uncultured Nonlabens sp.]
MFKVKKHKALFIFIALTATIMGSLAFLYLPDRFFADANTITLDRYNEAGWMGSYPFTMSFYKLIGFNNLPYSIVALIQLPILFYCIYKLSIPESFSKPYLRNVIVWICLIMICFFISFPSKEFINIIFLYFVAKVLIMPKNLRYKIFSSILMFVGFGIIFRQYYIIVPVIAISLYLINLVSIKNKAISNVFFGILIVCFLSLSYGVIKGEFMSEGSRESLNQRRIARGDQNADTMILSPVDSHSAIGESISIFYGFFTVNLPLNGLKFWYKPQVILFLLWQFLMFYLLFNYYSKALKNEDFKHETWVFHLVFSYFILQGVFEPDLGSAIRHKIGILPLIWLAIYYDKGFIKRPKIKKKYVFRITK